MKKLRVAILGSGNIGTDLLVKALRSPYLSVSSFVGRQPGSQGLKRAQDLGVTTSPQGIYFLKESKDEYDLVFDATSAQAHLEHAPILSQLGKISVDLTPAKVGKMCVPAVNMDECYTQNNINMVTCGGQASIPVVHAIAKTQNDIDYIEVVSSIASKSAGPATRYNLDEYVHTTEAAVKRFSSNPETTRCKAILNLNPAQPCINMQTTIMAKLKSGEPDFKKLEPVLNQLVQAIQSYVPGYELLVKPVFENGRIITTIRVKGLGDYLPTYAGNLDIINCAALAVAENIAKKNMSVSEKRSLQKEVNV